jgi:hypothetical protein
MGLMVWGGAIGYLADGTEGGCWGIVISGVIYALVSLLGNSR